MSSASSAMRGEPVLAGCALLRLGAALPRRVRTAVASRTRHPLLGRESNCRLIPRAIQNAVWCAGGWCVASCHRWGLRGGGVAREIQRPKWRHARQQGVPSPFKAGGTAWTGEHSAPPHRVMASFSLPRNIAYARCPAARGSFACVLQLCSICCSRTCVSNLSWAGGNSAVVGGTGESSLGDAFLCLESSSIVNASRNASAQSGALVVGGRAPFCRRALQHAMASSSGQRPAAPSAGGVRCATSAAGSLAWRQLAARQKHSHPGSPCALHSPTRPHMRTLGQRPSSALDSAGIRTARRRRQSREPLGLTTSRGPSQEEPWGYPHEGQWPASRQASMPQRCWGSQSSSSA